MSVATVESPARPRDGSRARDPDDRDFAKNGDVRI
jgi:hypothetical protein